MKKITTDVDVDVFGRDNILKGIECIFGRIDRPDGKVDKHNTGVYFHPVPVIAEQNISAIPYEQAEKQGYFKIDFLNVGVYKGIRNEDHLSSLMKREPLWDLLEDDSFTDLLFHVNGHGDILRKMKPQSVEQLSAVLAMIRPAKRYLIGKDWAVVNQEIWQKPATDEYFFKKSHALAYAVAIVVQMNLICEQISYEFS
jgi:hypothetical protein